MKIKKHDMPDTEKILEYIINHVPMPACIIDMANFHVLYHNLRFSQLVEYRERTEKRCHILMYGNDTPCENCPILSYERHSQSTWDIAETFHAQSGSWITTHSIIIELPGKNPLYLAFLETYNNPISYSREKTPSHFDSLTGLVNYRGYEHEGTNIYTATREQERPLAVIALKVDGLHQVNTLYGYAAGDDILKKLAHAILGTLPPNALFVRLRRNDFCALVPMEKTTGSAAILRIMEEICQLPAIMCASRKQMSLCQIFAGASVMENGESFNDLNFLAWDACSRAITGSESPCEIVEGPQIAQRIILKSLKNELPSAIAERQMELFFQPKYDVRRGTMVGAEALIRWNHSVHGQISPGLFIPMAERSGQIGIIDTWVAEEACRIINHLKNKGNTVVPVSINVSPRTFFDASLEKKLLNACERHGVDPGYLELELTESTALRNFNLTLGIMKRLREKGFRIAMDDFGVGHSSLSNLGQLPFDTIKIDRSFIATPTQKTRRIFPAIVSLVRSHEMDILIEGVETREQLDMVQDAGCRYIQGFYFSRPMPLEGFAEKLSAIN